MSRIRTNRLLAASLASLVCGFVAWLAASHLGTGSNGDATSVDDMAPTRGIPAQSPIASEEPRRDQIKRTEPPLTTIASSADYLISGWVLSGLTRNRWPSARIRAKYWVGALGSTTSTSEIETTCDEFGEFSIGIPRQSSPLHIEITGDEPDSHAWPVQRVLFSDEVGASELEICIDPWNRRVIGTVRDEQGAVVANAQVWMWGVNPVTVDKDGRYSLPASSFHQRRTITSIAPGFAETSRQIRLDLNRAIDSVDCDIKLKRGASIVGVVKDEVGNVVPSAQIRASGFSTVRTNTDNLGEFHLIGIPAESECVICCDSAGYVRAIKRVHVESSECRCDVTLCRGASVSGTVLLADGRPARGAAVYIGESKYVSSRVDAICEEDGTFYVPAFASGKTRIVATMEGYASAALDICVPENGSMLRGIGIRLERENVALGSILDVRGGAIAGAAVYFCRDGDEVGTPVFTNYQGAYCIKGLPTGSLEIRVDCAGYIRISKVVDSPTGFPPSIRLRRAGTVSGVVFDAQSGLPIPSFRVRLVSQLINPGNSYADTEWYRAGREFRSNDGVWNADREQIEDGHVFDIEVSATGYFTKLVKGVRFTAEADREPLITRLESGGSLVGVVRDAATGLGIEGVEVRLVTSVGDDSGSGSSASQSAHVTSTDESGSYSFMGIQRGRSSLVFQESHYAFHEIAVVEVVSGETQRVATTYLERTGAVSGKIVDVNGSVLSGVQVCVRRLTDGDSKSAEIHVLSDASGVFSIEGLSAGEVCVSIHVLSTDGNPIEMAKNVKILAGRTSSCDFAML